MIILFAYIEKISNNLARMTVTANAIDGKIDGYDKDYKLNDSFKIAEKIYYEAIYNRDESFLEVYSRPGNIINVYAKVNDKSIETKVIIFRIS